MNAALAAPAKGLPFLPTAFVAHSESAATASLASASHFFRKDCLAAPAKGLPFLPMALASQSEAVGAAVPVGAGV